MSMIQISVAQKNFGNRGYDCGMTNILVFSSAVDPVVVNILAWHRTTNVTYGLYKNRRSVLMSVDGGYSWNSTGN